MPETQEPNSTTPAAIPGQYAEVLTDPLPPAASLDPSTRIARIQLYKEMRQKGIFVPPEHLRFAIELITLDRANKASEARKSSTSAKKASAPVGIPNIEDL